LYQEYEAFFEDLQRRGLRHPLLVVSDGNAGLIGAIERHFPRSDRQRCLVHKLRNIAAKLPRDAAETVLREFKLPIFCAPFRFERSTLRGQI
jgi:transposase-like protein